MKHATHLLSLFFITPASAQLLNASFENVVGGDLSYWDHSCIAQSVAGGAPSSGNWCAEVEASNPQGCFPGWLYQVVPSVYDGMPFFLGGWCRNTDGLWMPAIGVDMGVMSAGGVITPMNIGPTTTDTTWTWLQVLDTMELDPNEQAVVLCNPGFVGGPAFALPRFDGIMFFETFPFSSNDGPVLNHYLDVANGSLHIASSNGNLFGVRLLDMLGRTLPTVTEFAGRTSLRVDLRALPTGVYFAVVRTDRGEKTVRIVVE